MTLRAMFAVCFKSEAIGHHQISARADVTTCEIHVLSGEDYEKLRTLIGRGLAGLFFKLLLQSQRWPLP